jgi:hypothetical protein
VEFDPVTGRVMYERLEARARPDRVGHLEPLASKLRDEGRKVSEGQCEVLSPVLGGRGLDEMDLLVASVQPGAPEAEVGPVGAHPQAEHLDVEGECRVDVVDVDRHVVNPDQSHWVNYGTRAGRGEKSVAASAGPQL